jgi:hypothetical protein
VLHLLAQHPQLPAFAGLQAVLPRLAEHGQYLLLASALAQVCLLFLLLLQTIICVLHLSKATAWEKLASQGFGYTLVRNA